MIGHVMWAVLWVAFMACAFFVAVGGVSGPPTYQLLLDWVVPDDALSGIGRVRWRKVDSLADQVRRGEVLAASGGHCFLDGGTVTSQWGTRGWDDRHGWVRWPSLRELLPVMQAPRGGITYARLP